MKKTTLALFALLAIAVLLGCRPEVVTPPKPAGEVEAPEAVEKEEAAQVKEPLQEPEEVKEKATEEGVKEKASEEEVEKEVETSEAEKEAEEVFEEEVVEESPVIKELLRRAEEKVKSYSYLYGGPETGGYFKNTYLIKGNRMVIKLYEEDYYVRENYYDTIYIDFVTKKAIGCCVTKDRCISANVDNTNKVFQLNLSEIVIPKTPYQWLKEINKAKVIGSTETFEERTVTPIQYARPDGTTVTMKLNNNYGLPHIVEIFRGEQKIAKHQFNDMKFNSYKDSDFIPPCAKR